MAPVPVGWTERQVAPGPVRVKDSQTSSTQLLERMINHTTLSTQRVLHNHILELGEQLRPSSSSPSPGPSPGPAQSPYTLSSRQLVGKAIEGDRPWTEVFSELAEEEKERALQQQKETLQARFTEALSARERLEAELRQGQRVELLARFERERAGLRAQAERETGLAVEEACERLRAQALREADEARQREAEAFQTEAQASTANAWKSEVKGHSAPASLLHLSPSSSIAPPSPFLNHLTVTGTVNIYKCS
ncbi:MAP7 domain-containing protein 1 [Anguilla rostrata]|uniref:MAP7 domain-containing protein 1 n=1 Tax=Anguilla rostrata TaxID=7938 RepID=UPI0030CBBECB